MKRSIVSLMEKNTPQHNFHTEIKLREIGHAFKMLGNNFEGAGLGRGSGDSLYWLHRMSNANRQLTNEQILNDSQAHLLQEAIDFAASAPTKGQIMSRIREGKPVIIPTGFSGHTTSVVIWGSNIVLCNRGAGNITEQTSNFYKFDQNKLDENIIDQILALKNGSEKEYEKFFYNTLPASLGYDPKKTSDMCRYLSSRGNLNWQIGGHCSYDNIEAAVSCLMLLEEFKDDTDLNAVTDERIDKLYTIKDQFQHWRTYNRIYHLERAIKAVMAKSKTLHEGESKPLKELQLIRAIFKAMKELAFEAEASPPQLKNKIQLLQGEVSRLPILGAA